MKIKGVLLQKGIVFETTYVFVLLYQMSSFQHNSNEFQTGGVNFTSATPKKRTLIRVKY